jgi:hypothetical protein
MRFKTHILSFLFILLVGMPAFSQQNSSSAPEIAELEQVGVLDNLVISPIDLEKEKVIYDENTDSHQKNGQIATIKILGNKNLLSVFQYGNGNFAFWSQIGDFNTFELEQRGNGNEFDGSLTGNDNALVVRQQGKMNYIYQDLSGNDMNIEVIQQGQGHSLIQEISPNSIDPVYKIHQQGNYGMKVMIKQEKLF